MDGLNGPSGMPRPWFDPDWQEANQRHLSAALDRVRGYLETDGKETVEEPSIDRMPASADEQSTPLFALDLLCAAFGLSPFERDVLVLCAGIELDGQFPSLCATAQRDTQKLFPTFSLALAMFPEAHWSAITPSGPLRRWRLVEVLSDTGGGSRSLTFSALRIDERVLHFLAGVPAPDERLAGIILFDNRERTLFPSHQRLAERIVRSWAQSAATKEGRTPSLIQLYGEGDATDKTAIVVTACIALGLNVGRVAASALPTTRNDREAFICLWGREVALGQCALLVDASNVGIVAGSDDGDGDIGAAPDSEEFIALLERLPGPVFLVRPERLNLRRPSTALEVIRPSAAEQRDMWTNVLGSLPIPPSLKANGFVDRLASQFSLNAETMVAAGSQALETDAEATGMEQRLWDACRLHARHGLDDLAQRIESEAGWDDLILPEAQKQILRDITAHVRRRTVVYNQWGFARRGARGLGITGLFAGASGTGKTMAAEVIAHQLQLDLYRIDLSSIVSKYIGETEKNLKKVFDAAEVGGAILLFDEADALFGKRSEVKDSHDRHANIEVSYLLQRMECYGGLAILTTNLKSALDTAFLRRIRFVVDFPYPGPIERTEIWRRIFPRETPTEGLNIGSLAKLNVAGGSIRNIAMNAAFLAADAFEPVRMTHLLRAARMEYAKLDKALTDSEIAGWV